MKRTRLILGLLLVLVLSGTSYFQADGREELTSEMLTYQYNESYDDDDDDGRWRRNDDDDDRGSYYRDDDDDDGRCRNRGSQGPKLFIYHKRCNGTYDLIQIPESHKGYHASHGDLYYQTGCPLSGPNNCVY